MKVAFASDHAGFGYKTILLKDLQQAGYDVIDLGAFSEVPGDDYPDYAILMAEAILKQKAERGIIICGSGVGVSIAANKFKGIRAGICHDTYSAHQSVEHDNANVLCIGERVVGIELVREIVPAFLKAQFDHATRNERRVGKINSIESNNMK